MSKAPDISVVVPVYNEEENVAKLVDEIAVSLDGRNYEMIFVNDASTDGTLDKLKSLKREGYKIEFCDVNHRHREFGVSKYTNFGRLMVSIADLRGVMWLNRRARNPEGWDEV